MNKKVEALMSKKVEYGKKSFCIFSLIFFLAGWYTNLQYSDSVNKSWIFTLISVIMLLVILFILKKKALTDENGKKAIMWIGNSFIVGFTFYQITQTYLTMSLFPNLVAIAFGLYTQRLEFNTIESEKENI